MEEELEETSLRHRTAAPRHHHHQRRRAKKPPPLTTNYDDVFGGPPRHAVPFSGVPDDYAEVFGGVSVSCSIPFLDLPTGQMDGWDCAGGESVNGVEYGEIFGRCDFADFAVPYEELFGRGTSDEGEMDMHFASANGRSSVKGRSGPQTTDPSAFIQEYSNEDDIPYLEDANFSVASDEIPKEYNTSYNKLSRTRAKELLHTTASVPQPQTGFTFVIEPNKPLPEHLLVVNEAHESSVNPNPKSSVNSQSISSKEQVSHGVPFLDVADVNLLTRSSNLPPTARPPPPKTFINERQRIDTFPKTDSVSNFSTEAEQPPLTQQEKPKPILKSDSLPPNFDFVPNLKLDKREKPKLKSRPNTFSKSESLPPGFGSELDAMKEAMEFAQARLKSAKELHEKRREGKITELPLKKKHVKEENLEGSEGEKLRVLRSISLASNFSKSREFMKLQGGVVATQGFHELEKSGKWRSDEEFHELTSIEPTKERENKVGITRTEPLVETNRESVQINGLPSTEVGLTGNLNADVNDTGNLELAGEIKYGEDLKIGEKTTIGALDILTGSQEPVIELQKETGEDDTEASKEYANGILKVEDIENTGEVEAETEDGKGYKMKVGVEKEEEDRKRLDEETKRHRKREELEKERQREKEIEEEKEKERAHKLEEEKERALQLEKDKERERKLEEEKERNLQMEKDREEKERRIMAEEEERLERERMKKWEEESERKRLEKEREEKQRMLAEEGERERKLEEERQEEKMREMEMVRKLEEEKERERKLEEEIEKERERVRKLEEEMEQERERVRKLEEEKQREREMARKLEKEKERERQLEEEIEKDRQRIRKLEEEREWERERVRKLEEERELERERVRKLEEEREEDRERVRKLEEEREKERIEKEREQKEREKIEQEREQKEMEKKLEEEKEKQRMKEKGEREKLRRMEKEREEKEMAITLEAETRRLETERAEEKDKMTKLQGEKAKERKTEARKSDEERERERRMKEKERKIECRKSDEEREKAWERRSDEERERERDRRDRRARKGREIEERERGREEEERKREREKDRLAMERATQERAERIAIERITAARQRAVENREKEEMNNRGGGEGFEKKRPKGEEEKKEREGERNAREARLRAERAAVERATAEARERAIEKAKAEAEKERDRLERFKSFNRISSQDHAQEAHFKRTQSDSALSQGHGESALRHKARLERQQRTAERAAKALAEKNRRDIMAQREQAERDRIAEHLDADVKRWSSGKEGNLRALLSTLQYILGQNSGWQSIHLTEVITAADVKKAYRKATLYVHPDKLQQRGASIHQKYICEKVFDLLKEAWNKFNSEER